MVTSRLQLSAWRRRSKTLAALRGVVDHYARAYQVAIDDAPALWMYEPGNPFGFNRRVRLDGLADRPDAWWMTIPAWDVTGTRR